MLLFTCIVLTCVSGKSLYSTENLENSPQPIANVQRPLKAVVNDCYVQHEPRARIKCFSGLKMNVTSRNYAREEHPSLLGCALASAFENPVPETTL